VRLGDGSVVEAGAVIVGVNVWDVNDTIQAVVRSGRTVEVARLGDPGVPPEELAGG